MTTIHKLNKLFADKEYIPKKDAEWQKIDKDHNVINGDDLPETVYKINVTIIRKAKLINKLLEKIKDYDTTKFKTPYTKISMFYNEKGEINIVSSTYSTHYVLLSALTRYFRKEQSYLTPFTGDIKDIKVRLVEIISPTKKRSFINQRKQFYEDLFNKTEVEEVEDNEMYNTTREIFDKIMDEYAEEFDCFRAYMFYFYSKTTNKGGVGYSNTRITKKSKAKIKQKFATNKKLQEAIEKYGIDDFNIELIETYNALNKTDARLRTDHHMISYDSVNNGYNKKYLVFDDDESLYSSTKGLTKIRENLFLRIQQELVDAIEDDTNYKNVVGFIYQVENINNCKKFISYTERKKNLKQMVTSLYSKALKQRSRYSKISNLLATVSIFDLEFDILRFKKKRSKVDLEEWTKKYRKKYNTIKNGYNVNEKKIRGNAYLIKKNV